MKTCVVVLAGLLAGTCAGEFADCTFKADFDGAEQRYLLDAPAGARDVLVWLHGHGSDRTQVCEARGEAKSARDVAAARGMAICSPDYRAKTSWMGPAAEADLLQLVRILKSRFSGRIFLVGGSMGGTSALTFAARHPSLVAGVTAFNPLGDHLLYGNFQDAIAASFGGTKAERPDEYRARSARYFPTAFTMPLSVTLGGKDTVVPPESARALVKAVAALRPDLVYLDEAANRGHETDYAASAKALREMFRRADACTVTKGGAAVQPSGASASGIWFYADGDSQLLLLGFEGHDGWRAVACGKGWALNGTPVDEAKDGRGQMWPMPLAPVRAVYDEGPVKGSPPLARVVSEALVEWDWRLRDGIGTPREPRTFAQAVVPLRARFRKYGLADAPQETGDEAEWLALHRALRAAVLARLPAKPIFFAKFVPSAMSHQLTQCLGYCARPGGGLFVLDDPKGGMRPREVTPANLPAGSFLNPELSPDATKVLFSYSPVPTAPAGTYTGGGGKPRFCTPERLKMVYSVYEAPLSGGEARRLTNDGFDDIFPIYLGGGDIVFSSTRRGGFHRCGLGPCPVFTLSRMGPNGENPHSISFHETHEWTPVLLGDGRLLYSRWDYVDRNGVLYQHLWTSRSDGGGAAIYYGNNTWNPCGTWEARPVPGSRKVMAIAGPHHAMAAGSVVLVDVEKGVDGAEPLVRLTPEVRFPESEEPVRHGAPCVKDIAFDWTGGGAWAGSLMDPRRNVQPTEEERRWPGETFKSPWPLSERLFLASFSFDRLVGEPGGNLPNQYGVYLCDADGARELLYRDPRISSVWARPVETRTLPPEARSSIDAQAALRGVGSFYLANVADGWPKPLPVGEVKSLRIFRILNKTTPNIDEPKVAVGQGAVGREVLGTVPVEADGSAYFEAPSGMPLYFQALDGKGRALQTMRSAVYLNPGERMSCVGCHEDRMKGGQLALQTVARRHAPSKIAPGPAGSRPFNFRRLVQPVLDAKCVRCHDGTRPKCPSLRDEPEGWATRSFNVLVRHVAWSGWGKEPDHNHEPMTLPGTFGAVASPLRMRLEGGHGGVELAPAEWERLNTWMDANGACWGTFDRDRQRDL